jgi:hypothetical protein
MAFDRLLKMLGFKPEEMHFIPAFGHLAATDLSEKEMTAMVSTAEWCSSKKMEPLTGYVVENKKGSYFVPSNGGMIMKIDCKVPPNFGNLSDPQYNFAFNDDGDSRCIHCPIKKECAAHNHLGIVAKTCNQFDLLTKETR